MKVNIHKSNTIRILLFIALLYYHLPGLQAQDLNEGFRGLDWGTSVNELSSVEAMDSFKYMKKYNEDFYYKHINEDPKIGTANLENIFYVFNEDNKFHRVMINGYPESFVAMKTILNAKYGIPDKLIKKKTSKTWLWKLFGAEVILIQNKKDDDFILHIISDWEDHNFYRINTKVQDL